MNKFKLKVLLITTLLFNFFIGVKNAFAAIRKTFSGGRSGQNSSSSSSHLQEVN